MMIDGFSINTLYDMRKKGYMNESMIDYMTKKCKDTREIEMNPRSSSSLECFFFVTNVCKNNNNNKNLEVFDFVIGCSNFSSHFGFKIFHMILC
jgi:hypothetical protein